MHQAPLQSTLNSHAESSIDATFLRDSDEVTKALRHDEGFELEQLIRSGRTTSPAYDNSILSSPNARIFSERAGSALTEPSTIGSHYGPDDSPTSKGKAAVASASSLSVGNGSASETEVHALRNTTLAAMGDWIKDDPAYEVPLRDGNKIKKRGHTKQQKGKKPPVRFQSSPHTEPPRDLPGHGTIATTVPEISHMEPPCMEPPHVEDPRMDTSTNSGTSIPNRTSPDKFQLRRRPTQFDDRMQLEEEGISETHEASQSRKSKRLTSTRKVVVAVLVMSIITTLAIAGFGAYHYGREQFACTKGIIFATTVIVAMLTSSAMVVATCTLQNALLAGLLEMAIGFMLLVELKDFMLISHLPP